MKKTSIVIVLVVLLISAAVVGGCFFTRAGTVLAAAETVYITSEHDFTSKLIGDCKSGATLNKTYVLQTDIYLSRYNESENPTLGGYTFNGTLEGNGRAIVGYESNKAFFAKLLPSATVKNLLFVGAKLVTGGSDAILVTDNLGTVSGVTVTGSAEGEAVGGIVAYNFGTIESCLAVVELTGAIPSGGTKQNVAAIALTNTSDALARISEDYPDYVGSYTVTGTHHPISDGYDAIAELGTNAYTEPDDLIADGLVSNYGELLCYLCAYAHASENSQTLPTATQTCYIDLYNADYCGIGDTLSAVLADGTGLELDYCGYYNAKEVVGSDVISDYATGSASVELAPSASLTGSGTVSAPYLVYTANDLIYLSTLTEKWHARLMRDIDLWHIAAEFYKPAECNSAFIPTLKGSFDGNGRSISGVLGSPLFGTAEEGSEINDLTVIGRSTGALVASALDGTADGVSAYGVAPYAFGSVGGDVVSCDISVGGAVANVLESSAYVKNTRNHGSYFVATESDATVENALNISDGAVSSFNVNAVNSVSYTSSGTPVYTADTDRYSLVDVRIGGSVATVTDGWTFATDASWGYLKNGGTEDLPTLVFAKDNVKYKKISVFSGSSAKSGVYGSIVGSSSFSLGDGTPLSKSYIEGLIINGSDDPIDGNYLDGLPLSVRKALEADGASISWIRPNGTLHTDENFDYGVGDTAFEIYLETSYCYISGSLTINESNIGVIEFSHVRYGLDNAYFVGAFGFDGLKAVFADVYGFTQATDFAHPIDYDGVTLEWYKDGSAYSGRFVESAGTYELCITVAPTADYTGAVFGGTYTITKGTLSLDSYELTSSLGGLTESSAPVYSGSEIAPTFALTGFRRTAVTYSYEVKSFSRTKDGKNLATDTITDAGIYSLEITVSLIGYEPYTRIFDFYVARKEAVVTPVVGKSQITYGDAHPAVTFRSDALNDFSGVSYNTTYSRFSAPGDYDVSVRTDAQSVNPNYTIVSGTDAQIKVVAAAIDASACGFNNVEVTYDGNAHKAQIDVSAIKTVSGDTQTYTYTVEYGYGEARSAEPFAFTDVGEYKNLFVTITPDTANYKPLTLSGVSVKILPLDLTITPNDADVNYNADAVYTVSVKRTDGGQDISENYLDGIVLGVDYTVSSAYQKSFTPAGAELTITVSILNEYVGNYRLRKGTDAKLTVGKRTYKLDVKTEYSYTGNPVVLDLNGESVIFEDGYPKYYYVTGGVEYLMDGAPQNVNDASRVYRVKIKTKETTDFYSAEKTVDFSIKPIEWLPAGLYLYGGESPVPFVGGNVVYNKYGYTVDLDRTTLPMGASFVWEYSYEYYDSAKNVWTSATSQNTSPVFKEPISVRSFSVSATDKNGNFNSFTLNATAGSVLSVVPKRVALISPPELEYRGQSGYTVEDIVRIVNSLGYCEGLGTISGDTLMFDVEYEELIKTPDEYAVKVIADSPSYVVDDIVIKVVKVQSTIELGSVQTFDYEYGMLYNSSEGLPSFIYRTNVFIGGEYVEYPVRLRVACSAHQTSYIAPGIYDIVSADAYTEEGVVAIEYTVVDGSGKVSVHPKTISYDRYNLTSSITADGIRDEYVYGDVGTIYDRVPMFKTTGALGNDNPQITLTPDRTVKHVGTYTFTAVATMTIPGEQKDASGNYIGVLCYVVAPEYKTFTTVVKPKEIEYVIQEKSIYIGDELPSAFTATYSGADGATCEFDVADFTSDRAGEFSVVMTLYNIENGIVYNDYTAVKKTAGAKELKVTARQFSADLVAQDTETIYTGTAVKVPVSGVPDGATVTQSLLPTNAGEYSVTVTVSKYGYESKVFDITLVIQKATPYIEQDKVTVEYKSGYIMSDEDIKSVRALVNGKEIDGVFKIKQTYPRQTLVYGEHIYKIDFTPADTLNYNVVKDLNYKIESYIVKEDVKMELGGIANGVITGKDTVTISAVIPEAYRGSVLLYVNGSVADGKYEFTESEDNVLIELKIGDEVLYSEVISVKVTSGSGTVVKPPSQTPIVSPDKSDTKFEVVDEEKTRTWIIVGSVVGGVVVIGGVIAIVLVVLKRKGKIGGKRQ